MLNAKKQISKGKAPRDDGIMPKIDIILFANKLLIIGEKQNKFAILISQFKGHWKLQRYQLNIGSRQAE